MQPQTNSTTHYFVRHGQSQANADGVLAGGSDSPLTDIGRAQAMQVALAILDSGIHFDTIITSNQSRALETAQIISRAIDLSPDDIITIANLREKSSGSYEGKPPEIMFAATEDEMHAAGGETLADFATRVAKSYQEVVEQSRGTTLIVGHSEWYRMAQVVRDNRPPTDMHEYPRPKNGVLLEWPIIPQTA